MAEIIELENQEMERLIETIKELCMKSIYTDAVMNALTAVMAEYIEEKILPGSDMPLKKIIEGHLTVLTLTLGKSGRKVPSKFKTLI